MRGRVSFLACLTVVALVAFLAIEPRLHHPFPSMVDDWNAILKAPEQLQTVLRLGNPEDQRYRPGFIAWNALQWHTLGAPNAFARAAALGSDARRSCSSSASRCSRASSSYRARPERGLDARWLLTLQRSRSSSSRSRQTRSTSPASGPQEPLLVGCMSLGAVLLVRSVDRLLEPRDPASAPSRQPRSGSRSGAFGVLQKETSLCVLLLIPFLLADDPSATRRWAR